jgi:uncharacterized protein (TIRG00374 family)
MQTLWPRIRNYLFLAVAAGLIYIVFKDVDFAWMWNEIKQANFAWIGLSIVCGILAMASRAYRWKLLLEPLGYKPGFLHLFYGVSIGYFANIALPRMGEVVRCTILNQTDNVPVNQSFGTVILERVIDVVMLLGLIALVVFTRYDLFGDFFMKEFFSGKIGSVNALMERYGLLLIILGLALLLALMALIRLVRGPWKHKAIVQKISGFLAGIGDGLITLFKMKRKWAFLFHTLFIWGNYFLMTWVCVYSYEPTAGLGPFDGLFLMVVGGLGMTAPVQGGFGAFHYLVEKALMIYQINPSINPLSGAELRPGLVFATIVHTGQFVMTVVLGALSLMAFTLFRRKKSNHESAPNP